LAFADRVGPLGALSFVLFCIALVMFTYRPAKKVTARIAELEKKVQQLEGKQKTTTTTHEHAQ
jgi:uncharacterized protein YoxC